MNVHSDTGTLVDLSRYVDSSRELLSGEGIGRDVRRRAGLDELDNQPEGVEIRFPRSVVTATTSFVRGLIGDSVVAHGEAGFRDKYHFTNCELFADVVEDAIARAARSIQYRNVA